MMLSTAEVMNFVKTIFLAAFVIVSLSSVADGREYLLVKLRSKKICQDRDIYKANHHNHWWCCYCAAGKFLSEDCSFGDPNSTKCTQCPFDRSNPDNQTYTLRPNRRKKCLRSFNASRCTDIRNTHWEMGSPTAPSYCQCNEGYFSPSHLLMIDGCNLHSPCEEGYEPYVIGNHTTNTRCHKCQRGTFSSVSSPTDLCQPFSLCKHGEEFPGNATSDVQCVEVTECDSDNSDTQTLWWTIPLLAAIILISVPLVIFCNCKKLHHPARIADCMATPSSRTDSSSGQRRHGSSNPSLDKGSHPDKDSATKLLKRTFSNGHQQEGDQTATCSTLHCTNKPAVQFDMRNTVHPSYQ